MNPDYKLNKNPIVQPESDVKPLDAELYEQLERDIDLSRLDMSEADIIDEFNNCINHGYDYDEIVEQFQFLLEDHNDYHY